MVVQGEVVVENEENIKSKIPRVSFMSLLAWTT